MAWLGVDREETLLGTPRHVIDDAHSFELVVGTVGVSLDTLAGVSVLASHRSTPAWKPFEKEESMASSPMLPQITNLLDLCQRTQSVMPPTTLYNEGWLLRLVLDWFEGHRLSPAPLAFEPESRWYSEALLGSRFVAQFRGDKRAETLTHADGVVGHFSIDPGVYGKAIPTPNAEQFLVFEAKLGSRLSKGTRNAPGYGQAARNVACMAHMLHESGLKPRNLKDVGFYVLAPEAQIKAGVFGDLVTRQKIEDQVRARVAQYQDEHDLWRKQDQWFKNAFMPTLEHMTLGLLSWESLLDHIEKHDPASKLRAFYELCLKFNRLK